jgi:hypothetical protein
MVLLPFTALAANNWVDLDLAAEYAGLPVAVLVEAVTARELRASTSHPDRLGDWMVPLVEVDEWWQRRQLVRRLG